MAIVPAKVPWLEFAVFVAVAVILAWVVCLPLWLSGEGIGNVMLVQVTGMAMMFTPLIAVVVAMLIQRRRTGEPRASIVRYLGIWPLRPFGRVLGMTALAFFGVFVLVAVAYLLGAAFGWMQVDLLGLSGFKAQLAQLPGLEEIPVVVAVIGYLAAHGVWGRCSMCTVAFGEEVGWRGWLLTSLRPLGTWPALIIVGVIWGLWHAPLILLGYNFARPDITGPGVHGRRVHHAWNPVRLAAAAHRFGLAGRRRACRPQRFGGDASRTLHRWIRRGAGHGFGGSFLGVIRLDCLGDRHRRSRRHRPVPQTARTGYQGAESARRSRSEFDRGAYSESDSDV